MAGCPSERSSNSRVAAILLGAAITCALSFGAPPRSTNAKVTAVRFWSLGDVTRVAIEVSSEFKYRPERLTNPDRLVFDIQGARPDIGSKGMHVIAVGDTLLKQMRVAETVPGVTRVVLDLEQPVEYTASQLSAPDRLMVELKAKNHPSAPATTSTSGVRKLTEAPANAVAPDLIAVATPLAVAPPVSAPPPVIAPPPAPVVIAKPEPRRFDPPPLRPDASRTPPSRSTSENKVELIRQPAFTPFPKSPIDPLPPPSVKAGSNLAKPEPTLVSTNSIAATPSLTNANLNNSSVANDRLVGPMRPATIPPEPKREAVKEALPARDGPRSLTRVLGLKLGRVVIDPGHGGHDLGTHGPSGLAEKEVVLDVSRRLGTLLEDRLGSEVVYTRSDDTFIPLEERTNIANNHKADLFLSIHANSSTYRTVAGVETYYLNFTTSRAALDLAARENATSERSVFDLKEILQKIALKDKIDESREFAASVQKSLYSVSSKGNVDAKNRGTRRAPFVVLIGASMPSVLAEIGFLTNPADEALLRKPEHRQKIAEALYKGIAGYAETLSHYQVAKTAGAR